MPVTNIEEEYEALIKKELTDLRSGKTEDTYNWMVKFQS